MVNKGEHEGKRGVISEDDGSELPYKVTFADGGKSGWLKPERLKSSGLDETAFLRLAMATSTQEVREACKDVSAEMCDALCAVRKRVRQDRLPLLSLLQAAPLQLQSTICTFD